MRSKLGRRPAARLLVRISGFRVTSVPASSSHAPSGSTLSASDDHYVSSTQPSPRRLPMPIALQMKNRKTLVFERHNVTSPCWTTQSILRFSINKGAPLIASPRTIFDSKFDADIYLLVSISALLPPVPRMIARVAYRHRKTQTSRVLESKCSRRSDL